MTEYDPLIKLGVITRNQSERVRELFGKLKEKSFRFGLNHGDISLKNTIVNQANQVILLDWGNAEVGVIPHGTVIQLMHYQILGLEEGPSAEEFKAFLDGYGICDENLAEMRHFLLLHAFDKLRWAIDQSPDLVKAYAAFAKQVVDIVMD